MKIQIAKHGFSFSNQVYPRKFFVTSYNFIVRALRTGWLFLNNKIK